MPAPLGALATLRPDLGQSMELFDLAANQAGYVGLEIAPVFETAMQAGVFGKIPVAELLQTQDTERAVGAAYGRGNWRFTSDTFACIENGWEEPVDDRESKMYALYFDAELVSARRARNTVLEGHERRVAALAAAVTNTNPAAAAWTDIHNSTPVEDVRAAVLALFGRVGAVAQFAKLQITYNRLQYLKDNAQIIDRAKYQSFQDVRKGNITAQQLAVVLGVAGIEVAGAVKNGAAEGQNASLSSIWPDNRALLWVPPMGIDIRSVCFARTLHWGDDGSSIGGMIEAYRDETRRSNIIRVRMDTHEKVMFADAAQAITGV